MSDEPQSPPLTNSPDARTPDGTLKEPTPTPTPTPTPPIQLTSGKEPTPDTKLPSSTAPESYTFTPPKGQTYDQTIIDKATPIFKELGLNQAAAEKLIGLWNESATAKITDAKSIISAQGERWLTELKADASVGSKIESIRTDIGRAFDSLIADGTITTKDIEEFKSAMDLSMVGNQRAFVKIIGALSASRVEGKSVTGGGPSPHGQNPKGQAQRPSLASAMYPNLSPAAG